MSGEILDGRAISNQIKAELAISVKEILDSGKRAPHLGAILVGDDPASQAYVGSKVKACEKIGFKSSLLRLPATTTEEELLAEVDKMNNDDSLDGFIVQLPLPKGIDETKVIEAIKPEKDVDGFHPINVGKLALGLDGFVSATPKGIIELISRSGFVTSGKHCVILGRSNIVGGPMSMLLRQNSEPGNCTVTVCHSRTKDLEDHTRRADILIAAIGKPEFVKADMVKEGAIVIDVGINRVDDASRERGYKLVGDVDYKEVAPKSSNITPVPGGVGPMTIAALLMNTLEARKKSK
ncbi:MAG: methylenetetrahydrofolate dehydrogenase (NADP+)/methenyltetrahydrofolate cyclohydrolase [Granulosicoccus sp.]|jgi:methylenetetrahydrofolate dehydrogenase (NADP+)/methenyltetrahydrofolate cyclohydrolase